MGHLPRAHSSSGIGLMPMSNAADLLHLVLRASSGGTRPARPAARACASRARGSRPAAAAASRRRSGATASRCVIDVALPVQPTTTRLAPARGRGPRRPRCRCWSAPRRRARCAAAPSPRGSRCPTTTRSASRHSVAVLPGNFSRSKSAFAPDVCRSQIASSKSKSSGGPPAASTPLEHRRARRGSTARWTSDGVVAGGRAQHRGRRAAVASAMRAALRATWPGRASSAPRSRVREGRRSARGCRGRARAAVPIARGGSAGWAWSRAGRARAPAGRVVTPASPRAQQAIVDGRVARARPSARATARTPRTRGTASRSRDRRAGRPEPARSPRRTRVVERRERARRGRPPSWRSQSPMPAVETTGSPAARYSPTFVGDDDRFEKQGLMNERPASAACSRAAHLGGRHAADVERIRPAHPPRPAPPQRDRRRSMSAPRRRAAGPVPVRAAKKRAISASRYHIPSLPT